MSESVKTAAELFAEIASINADFHSELAWPSRVWDRLRRGLATRTQR